jgi:VWFA-related protein
MLASPWFRSAHAQSNPGVQTPNESSYQLKLESNLVIVRVVVRDAKGIPIRGLKKEDFRLFDQGKEQSITQFEEVSSSDAPSGSMTAAVPAQAANPSVAAPRDRFIALYFDDLNSSDADLMQARDAADHHFSSGLLPSDHVAIFSAEKMLSDFTSDPQQIHEALMQLHASSLGLAKEHPCPDLSDYQALELLHTNDPESDAWQVAWAEAKACPVKSFASSPNPSAKDPDPNSMVGIRMLAQRIVDRSQELARDNLQQFEKVVNTISRAPGERSVVLVSPGFLSQSEQYALDRIVDRALRAQVVVNSLDPKGLFVLLRESDASKNTTILADARASQARNHLDASREFVGADVMAELAEGTGGEFFHSDNDLKAGFGALTGNPPHYILAFSPTNAKWDGKFHVLKVSLATKQKGSSIQARRGYFADPKLAAAEQAGAATTPPAPAAAAKPIEAPQLSKSQPEVSNPGTSVSPGTNAPMQPPQNEASNTPPALPPAGPAGNSAENRAATTEVSPEARSNAKPFQLRKGTNRLTVEQLEQVLATAHGRPDADLARQLTGLELTQRLDSPRLAHFEADLPGPQSRQALVAQADASAFLNQPASPTPLPATPTVDEQIKWLKMAADYAIKTLSKLPDFFATRDVTRFADTPAKQELATFYPYEPLHAIDRSKATVLYREGKQVVDSQAAERTTDASPRLGLVTTGEFGPILGTVLADASRSSLSWSHWEQDTSGTVGVYRFAVPRDKSHYQVKFCCVSGGRGIGLFEQISAYHGEITVDPANGNILRITLQADMKDVYPVTRADLSVEYGPVEIGGKTYICPLRSVAIVKAYVKAPPKAPEVDRFPGKASDEPNLREMPLQTMMNDIAFGQYHLFRSDSRILPADSEAPQ